MRSTLSAVLATLLSVTFAPVRADYPERPVKIIVPFQVGGAGDAAARALADGLSNRTGQPFVVDNRPGATGLVGTQAAATAAADGYTLFLGHSDMVVLNPILRKKLPYDASKKFESVAFVSRVAGVLIARPGSGIGSGETLIAAARARPGQVSLATWGLGSSAHMGIELMNQIAGIELLHVPFQSTVAAVGGLLSGLVDLAWVTPEFAVSAARDGRASIVGASSATRIARAPEIKTLAEQGFPGIDVDTWYGLMAPPGTPAPVRRTLHALVNALLSDPNTSQRLRQAGHEVQAMTAPEFDAYVARDQERWRALVRTRKIALELD